MGNEADMWGVMKSGMMGRWDAVRIETSTRNGVPDVQYCLKGGYEGWLENKRIPRWPAKPGSVVRIDHLTTEQRLFNKMRQRWGGKSFVCVMVEQEWFLFDNIEGLGLTWARADWYKESVAWWKGQPNWQEFRGILKEGRMGNE